MEEHKMGMSQGTYLKILGMLFLFIAFGSCFSMGYNWIHLNPGDWLVKISFIMLYFLGFYYFYQKGNEIIKDEASLPTAEQASKIVEDFEASRKKRVVTSKGIHKVVHK